MISFSCSSSFHLYKHIFYEKYSPNNKKITSIIKAAIFLKS